MISVVLALGAAQAQPARDEPVEEVIVWADPFLRWNKRWYVETEVMFPLPFRLMGYLNNEVWVGAVQVRAVLACRNDGGSKRLIEAFCEIEDIAMVGLSNRRAITDARSAVLTEIDAALTGVEVQLQAKKQGTVPNVDIEGLTTRNNRSRQRQESLRQLMMRAIVPFHLKLPRTIRSGAKWFDHDSRMMSVPTLTQASSGGTTVAHYMNNYEGTLLVQSKGAATVRLPGETVGVAGEIGTTQFVERGAMLFDLELDSVSIFDPDSGIMNERVWSVRGQTTASSVNTQPIGYHHVGALRMLGDDDRPDVGDTKLVDKDGWVPWTPPS